MILETAQMLSTTARTTHGTLGTVKYLDRTGTKKTRERLLITSLGEYSGMWEHERNPNIYWDVHHKHPCTLWAGKSYHNWRWLCKHGLAMSDEFKYRYNNRHKSSEVIRVIYENKMGPDQTPFSYRTGFAQAMPDQYKQTNAVEAYRSYYLGEKRRFAKWTKRNPPNWWKESV